jgi:hypothetical protein
MVISGKITVFWDMIYCTLLDILEKSFAAFFMSSTLHYGDSKYPKVSFMYVYQIISNEISLHNVVTYTSRSCQGHLVVKVNDQIIL